MSLAEIIDEIDAYLLLLQRARTLLEPLTKGKKGPRRHKTPPISKARERVLTRGDVPPSAEEKLPATIPTRQTKRKKEAVAIPQIVSAEPKDSADTNDAATTTGEPASKPSELVSPAPREERQVTLAQRSPMPRKAISAISVPVKPAMTTSKPVPAGWVVVSAEEAKRQREQVARPAPIRSAPQRGTGKSAFEALFRDASQSAGKSSDVKP